MAGFKQKCGKVSLKIRFRVAHRDVTEPAKIHIREMRISCAKSIGCGFVARSELATAIQLSYLNLNSNKQTSSE